MRGWRHGVGLLLAFLLGCSSPNIAPKPPKNPEEIVVPPVADLRFSNPPNYPESNNFNNDPGRGPGGQPNLGAMNTAGAMNGMNGMGRGMGGMGGGMGGMGMGGMGMGGMGR